jgi:hypothetical protein
MLFNSPAFVLGFLPISLLGFFAVGPTVRSTHRAGYLCVLVWCKACHHQAPADLQAIIDGGRGDVPLKDLKFRCAQCGSRRTDAVMMGKGGVGVQPWRAG